MYGEHEKGTGCIECRYPVLLCRGLVGVAGATTVVFLGVWVDKLKLSLKTSDLFILIGLCCLSGTASFRLLPKLGRKLEEQILRDEMRKNREEVKKEVLISKRQSEASMEYASSMAQSREALESKSDNDMKQALIRLKNVVINFPTDRTLNIYLGRLHRWTGDIDSAILSLRRYIEEIGRASKDAPDRYLFDKSAALYNIACYHAVKADGIAQRGGPTEDIQRLSGEAIVALEESLNIWSKHADTALGDSDFDFLKNSPAYADKFNRLVRGHQKSSPSREEVKA
jgi:hypothetical protein